MLIENEVAKQVHIVREEETILNDVNVKKPKKQSKKKLAVFLLAATLVIGGTIFASGPKAYKVFTEAVGNYGVNIGILIGENGSAYGKVPKEIQRVAMEHHYIPEGMVQSEGESKMYYEDTPWQGGISMGLIAMDNNVEKESLTMMDTDILNCEQIEITGHDAVYLEKVPKGTDTLWFDKRLYIVYPEIWYILQVFGGTDISKEEMLRVVENTEFVETGETYRLSKAYTWSDMLKEMNKEAEPYEWRDTVSIKEMKNVHSIGEEFSVRCVNGEDISELDCITATVTEVEVFDDLSILENSSYIDAAWKNEVGEDGKLLQNEIQYIRSGDGIKTTDEVIRTEMVNQKLVYITVEYKNNGKEDLQNIMYGFSLTGIQETDGEYVIYDRANLENQREWGKVYYKGEGQFGRIDFYDTHGGERNNNYIPEIKAGEAVTVHFAQIVNEDELQYMYLNLDTSQVYTEFTERGLEQGYVDIRQ